MTETASRAFIPWGYMPPGMQAQVRRELDWQRYLAEAHALGYTEREARLVAAGVLEVAKQIPQGVDVLSEARKVLAEELS